MINLFRIRRDERWLALLALVLMVALNVMMLCYNHDLFTRGGRLGYYGLFTGHFTISGYDDYMYIMISKWNYYYSLFRHPLITALFYPFYLLNMWQMEYTGANIAIYIVAFIMVACGLFSFLFLHRIMREIVGMGRADSLLFTLFFYSFAHVMVASFVPDHFGMSLFLLLLTLYVAGCHLKAGSEMGRWPTAVLYIITAGISLTNGAKTLLAALFCGGRRFFRWRYFSVVVLFSSALLLGAYYVQYYTIQKPNAERDEAHVKKLMKTDKKMVERMKKRDEWRKTHAGEKLVDSPYFEWTDKSTSRLKAAVENFFGESVQLHQRYLLQDTNRTRPNYVAYDRPLNYVVEAIVVLLFAGGVWVGRRKRFMQLCLSWFSVELLLHFVLGFGILEVYIMTAHWIFIIPIATAFLLRSAPCRAVPWLRGLLVLLTAWLWIYNGSLLVPFVLHL